LDLPITDYNIVEASVHGRKAGCFYALFLNITSANIPRYFRTARRRLAALIRGTYMVVFFEVYAYARK